MGIIVKHAGQRGAEAGQMGAAVDGIHAVGKTEDVFAETVVILQRDFNPDAVIGFRHGNRLFVDDRAVMVQVAHKAGDAALEVKGLLLIVLNIGDGYFQPFIEVSHFPHTFAESIEIIFHNPEDFRVGQKGWWSSRCLPIYRPGPHRQRGYPGGIPGNRAYYYA